MELRLVLKLLATSCVSACASSLPPTPGVASSPSHHLRCDSGAAEEKDLRLLRAITALEVEPVRIRAHDGGAGSEDAIERVKMVVRPPNGVSPERMAELLRCHSARTLMGQVDASQWPSDPFWLPGTWIHIDVRPEAGNYAVIMEAANVTDNLRLASRAKAFAAERKAGL